MFRAKTVVRQQNTGSATPKSVARPPRQNVTAARQNRGAQSIRAGNARAQEHAKSLLVRVSAIATGLGGIGGKIVTFGATMPTAQLFMLAIIILSLIYALYAKISVKPENRRKRFLEGKVEEFTNMLDRQATQNARVNVKLFDNYARGKMSKNNYEKRINNLRGARSTRNAGLRDKINEYRTELNQILREMNDISRAQNAVVGIRTAPVTRMIQNTTAAVVAAGPAVKSATELVVAVSGASVAMTQALTARNQARSNAEVKRADAEARVAEARLSALTKQRTQAVRSWTGVVRESASVAGDMVTSTATAVGGMATAVGAARAALGV